VSCYRTGKTIRTWRRSASPDHSGGRSEPGRLVGDPKQNRAKQKDELTSLTNGGSTGKRTYWAQREEDHLGGIKLVPGVDPRLQT